MADAVIKALHTVAIGGGIVGAAAVIGSFIGSLPSITAVLLNYAKRGDARGTWVYTHYQWQHRTFWCAVLWALLGWALVFTIIGVVIGVPILIALTLWLLYRIGRGWLRLRDRQPIAWKKKLTMAAAAVHGSHNQFTMLGHLCEETGARSGAWVSGRGRVGRARNATQRSAVLRRPSTSPAVARRTHSDDEGGYASC